MRDFVGPFLVGVLSALVGTSLACNEETCGGIPPMFRGETQIVDMEGIDGEGGTALVETDQVEFRYVDAGGEMKVAVYRVVKRYPDDS